jgi:beta-lactamase regulating signal transducer with metallopeptidase domain
MILLLSVTIKVAVLALAALAATVLLRRRSAAVRHFVLATAFFCSMAIPALERMLPSWSVPLLSISSTATTNSSLQFVTTPAVTPVATRATADNAGSHARTVSAITWLMSIWISGTLIGCGVLLVGLLRLRKLAADSEPVSSGAWREIADETSRRYGIRRPVRILHSRHPTMLATWGVLNPAVILPAGAGDWPMDRIHAVVRHELAHVRRGDWVVGLTANAVTALYWFNPLLWAACRRLRHESERACDDIVLASGISGTEYAAHLLAVARHSARHRHPWSPAIAIAHRSMLEGRVRAMLNARVNREPLTILARVTTVAVLVAVTMWIGSLSVSGETSGPGGADLRSVSPAIAPAIAAEQVDGPREAPAASIATQGAQRQPAAGTVEGVLYDQFGGLLPGASVKLTQISTGGVETGVTDRAGSFVFRGLESGDYELVTELPGFITVRNVVRAEQGQTTRRHITLPIGTLQETIHVTCSSSDRVTTPTAPTRSASPGPAERQAAKVQRGTEPKIPGSAFTGGIGGQIAAPRKLAHVSPVCPANAISESTVVRLAGRVGIDGLFSDLRDVSTDAQPAYVASALEAARQWVFTPTLLNGAPIEANIAVTISYSWSN